MLRNRVRSGNIGKLVCRCTARGLVRVLGSKTLLALIIRTTQITGAIQTTIEQVLGKRGFEGLVVFGQRAIHHAVAFKSAILLPQHEERLVVGLDLLGGAVGQSLGSCKVGDIHAGLIASYPLLFVQVPLDQRLVLRPRLTLKVCRSTVVDDAAVVRPSIGPVGGQTQA